MLVRSEGPPDRYMQPDRFMQLDETADRQPSQRVRMRPGMRGPDRVLASVDSIGPLHGSGELANGDGKLDVRRSSSEAPADTWSGRGDRS